MKCSKCGTTGWKGTHCPFCGNHEHGKRGQLCSCGEYIPTKREELEQAQYEFESELEQIRLEDL